MHGFIIGIDYDEGQPETIRAINVAFETDAESAPQDVWLIRLMIIAITKDLQPKFQIHESLTDFVGDGGNLESDPPADRQLLPVDPIHLEAIQEAIKFWYENDPKAKDYPLWDVLRQTEIDGAEAARVYQQMKAAYARRNGTN